MKIILLVAIGLIAVVVVSFLLYINNPKKDLVQYFSEELQRSGVELAGQPIEGFSAFIYLNSFPGFVETDFDGVASLEGVYKIVDGRLIYERTSGNPVTSAEDVISDEGYTTLLENLSSRLGIKVSKEADVLEIIERIGGSVETKDTYEDGNFSIMVPEGWYAYELQNSVLFTHDEELKMPQNTEGYALGPQFQVTVQEKGLEETLKENLWTKDSEFVVSSDIVSIRGNEATRIVTEAGGAGGEVLNYIFEATDGRAFTLSHYPYQPGSSDTDDFERAAQSFVINYTIGPKNFSNDGAKEGSLLTRYEAKEIAESLCIKGGGSLEEFGFYNENSKTWWFDANLNVAKEGCNPACVVSEDKTAEINWRCTGLTPE